MQKPSEITRSQQTTGLTILSKSVILKEQDSKEVIKHLAHLVNRLGKLYLIPNWSDENAVILAEWIYDNYKWESLEAVQECLKNPPVIEKTWRLTPDVITAWMEKQLEKETIKREQENNRLKENFKEELPGIDYPAYAKRIEEGKALQEPDKLKLSGFADPSYQAWKAERDRKRILEQGKVD